MNSTFWGVIVLTCVFPCTSVVNKRCLCLTKKKSVNAELIANIKERLPRPYCGSYEVIAILKTGGSSCLDPGSNDIQEIVRTFKKRKEETTTKGKVKDISRETAATPPTTSSTDSTKASPAAAPV